MIECINCSYFYTDGKEEFCCYYNDFIDRIILIGLCEWINEEYKIKKQKN